MLFIRTDEFLLFIGLARFVCLQYPRFYFRVVIALAICNVLAIRNNNIFLYRPTTSISGVLNIIKVCLSKKSYYIRIILNFQINFFLVVENISLFISVYISLGENIVISISPFPSIIFWKKSTLLTNQHILYSYSYGNYNLTPKTLVKISRTTCKCTIRHV